MRQHGRDDSEHPSRQGSCLRMERMTATQGAEASYATKLDTAAVSKSATASGYLHVLCQRRHKKRAAGSPPPPSCVRPEALRALRLALFVSRGQLGRTHVHRARLGGRGVRHGRGETISRHGDRGADDAARRVVVGAEVARVLDRVGEIRLFGGDQVTQIRLHRSQIRLLLRVRELRNRDGGKNADNHHDDQKLDECKALAVHLNVLSRKYYKRDATDSERHGGTDRAVLEMVIVNQ